MTDIPITRRHLARLGTRTIAAATAVSMAGAASAGTAEDAEGRAAPSPLSPPAEERMAIIELMAIYAWAYDTQDAEALAFTFTADGQLEVFGNVLIASPADIPAFLAQASDMRGDHGWQHLTDHHLFRDYDGKSCTVYSYYTMPESDAQGGNGTMRAMGYYVSHCRRGEAGWKFARRSVNRWNGRAPVALV